jgi:LysM repeat protein
LAILAGALAIAALALFFLPALLGVGEGGKETTTPAPSSSQGVATASPKPTAPPAPTPQVYVIKSGDTMSKIATSFGLTSAELCEANKDTVADCDKIKVGAELIIPVKPPDEFSEPSAGAS